MRKHVKLLVKSFESKHSMLNATERTTVDGPEHRAGRSVYTCTQLRKQQVLAFDDFIVEHTVKAAVFRTAFRTTFRTVLRTALTLLSLRAYSVSGV